jgi:hypothetical protein
MTCIGVEQLTLSCRQSVLAMQDARQESGARGRNRAAQRRRLKRASPRMARSEAMQKRRETSRFVPFVIRVSWCVLALASQSCGSENSARAEANEVLERIARLDPSVPVAARRAAIAAVSALPVSDKELDALRAVCLKAHQGLLDAEVMQGDVRTALDGTTPPSPEQLPALQTKMEQATATLVAAQAALATCETRSREATIRYR